MDDLLINGLHYANNRYVWGTAITLALYGSSISVQNNGNKRGGLIISIPCSMLALGGLVKAYTSPENRVMCLIGTGMAGAGAIISSAPEMIKDDNQARSGGAVYSTTTIATALGVIGCALISPEGQLQVANPLAPVVQAVQPQPQPDTIVNNPMNARR